MKNLEKTKYFEIDSCYRALDQEINSKYFEKKICSEYLSEIYTFLDYSKRALRVKDCGTFLDFEVGEDSYKLVNANFCRDRLCPMCNWRRSKKAFNQISKIVDQMSGYEFIFLTLTVRNCAAEDLCSTIDMIYNGWRYLYNKNAVFKNAVKGSFRALEVTYNFDTGEFHPHLHCILAVKPSYFHSLHYVSHSKWIQLWQYACKLQYRPSVFVEKIKSSDFDGVSDAVAEVSKYPFKTSELLQLGNVCESARIVKSLLIALKGRRLCGFTGIFNSIRKELNLDDIEDGDLNDAEVSDGIGKIIVKYRWKIGCYVLTN